MFFYRRDPYYVYSPFAGCLGSLLITLIVATILIVCAIYIGFYVLLGLLIIGAIVGGLVAVFSLFKALPQTIRDMSGQIYRGNKVVVLLKKIGYFYICIAKYSISNDWHYAKNAFQRFAAKRTLSFSKWVNFALALTVIVFGLLILFGILFFSVLLTTTLITVVFNISIIFIAVIFGVGYLYNLFLVVIESVRVGKRSFSPVCVKFTGRCYFSDLLLLPKTFFVQMGTWVGGTFKNSMNLLNVYKTWLNTKKWILVPIAIAFIISCPISALFVIVWAVIILFALAVPVYVINAFWILIKAIFKF